MARDKWATPENLETCNKILSEVLIETGLAVANPLFNPTVEWNPNNPNYIPDNLASLFSFD